MIILFVFYFSGLLRYSVLLTSDFWGFLIGGIFLYISLYYSEHFRPVAIVCLNYSDP